MSTSRIVNQLLMLTMAAFIASTLSGCATLLSDSSYPVTIDNKGGPTYFNVYDRKNQVVQSGVTPQQVTLKSKAFPFWPAHYKVAFASQEWVQEQDLKADFDWWTTGNIVLGGAPGLVVDGASGAMWKLQPSVTGQVAPGQVMADPSQGSSILASWATEAEKDGTLNQKPGFTKLASFWSRGSAESQSDIQHANHEF